MLLCLSKGWGGGGGGRGSGGGEGGGDYEGGGGSLGVSNGLTLSREVRCCVESDGWRGDRWDSRWEHECGTDLEEANSDERWFGMALRDRY